MGCEVNEVELRVGPGTFALDEARQPWWKLSEKPSASFYLADERAQVPLSILRTFPRKLRFGPFLFSCWGIGWVFTQEKYRRLGFATELILKTCRALAEEERFEHRPLAVLYCNEDQKGFYEKLGFFPAWRHEDGKWFSVRALARGVELHRQFFAQPVLEPGERF
jgi:GNAT superfamily N-acetyltransferase